MYGKDTAFCLQSHIVMCCFVKPYKITVMQQLTCDPTWGNKIKISFL